MPRSETLFATKLYRARLAGQQNRGLEKTCLAIAAEDKAGRRWAKSHGYGGYTSYASLNDLTHPRQHLRGTRARYRRPRRRFCPRAAIRSWRQRKLKLDSLWINVMKKGAIHAPHIHPHSVISGTYYVTAPDAAGAIRFEDPRLAMLMAAPPKKKNARLENRTFVDVAPKPGMLLLWESWLRHGVEPNAAKTPRISLSFNYA